MLLVVVDVADVDIGIEAESDDIVDEESIVIVESAVIVVVESPGTVVVDSDVLFEEQAVVIAMTDIVNRADLISDFIILIDFFEFLNRVSLLIPESLKGNPLNLYDLEQTTTKATQTITDRFPLITTHQV